MAYDRMTIFIILSLSIHELMSEVRKTEVVQGVDIWPCLAQCLAQVGVPFLGFCCPLLISGECSSRGLPDMIEYIRRPVGSREWGQLGEKAQKSFRKEFRVLSTLRDGLPGELEVCWEEGILQVGCSKVKKSQQRWG